MAEKSAGRPFPAGAGAGSVQVAGGRDGRREGVRAVLPSRSGRGLRLRSEPAGLGRALPPCLPPSVRRAEGGVCRRLRPRVLHPPLLSPPALWRRPGGEAGPARGCPSAAGTGRCGSRRGGRPPRLPGREGKQSAAAGAIRRSPETAGPRHAESFCEGAAGGAAALPGDP